LKLFPTLLYECALTKEMKLLYRRTEVHDDVLLTCEVTLMSI